MEIEIQKRPAIQEGVPGSVCLLLRDSEGKYRGFVTVAAVKEPAFRETKEEFRVEVLGGNNSISPHLDLKAKL